jgi:serine/threonine-protein kinase
MNVTPKRWQQVVRIYEMAVDHDPLVRHSFLSDVCAGDDALQREVESLLLQDAEPAVVDRSVWAIAARLFDDGPNLRPGTTVGPYRIESTLGAGGMGEVFRATDTRLNRQVAIKVLPTEVALDPEMRVRFAQEARAVAALTHSHICRLYDVGRHDEIDFLVMEYLEGDTLATRLAKGPVSVDDAVAYAIEIASAIDHAHRHQVVHRDLKPANILLTATGAKLLDFGLAKLRPTGNLEIQERYDTHEGTPEVPTRTTTAERPETQDAQVTRDGILVGTVRYMSPEQIAGGEADNRSDIFSFGAVLFEMLTGRRAFAGDSTDSIRTAILSHEPPSVSSLQPLAPRGIDEIVRRCLAKAPNERWQTAGEVLQALTRITKSQDHARTRTRTLWVSTAAVLFTMIAALVTWGLAGGFQSWSTRSSGAQIRSIALLPLENLSGDPGQDFFADGVTEQLIAGLAKNDRLRVISTASVMSYKNARKPLPTIARELQVDAIVEGSVAVATDKARINVKLSSGRTGEVIWSQSFERDTRDVMTLQSEVAWAITGKIDPNLTPQQAPVANARPVDPEIHRQVLLGRHHASKATEDGLRTAVRNFNVAIGEDSSNAMAHAGLAEAYMGLNGFYMHPRQAMPSAKRAAEAALKLDESLAGAHAALGYIHLVYDWDATGAEKALRRALELNPALAPTRLYYAALLTTQERHEEAVREIRRAVEFDPVSLRTNAVATSLLLFTRRYDEAIQLARRGLEFEPNNAFALAFQGIAYAQQGRFAEAVSNLRRAEQLDQSPTVLALEALGLAISGQKDAAARLIHRVEESTKHRYFCPYEIGAAYVGLGDADTAYRWFRKGVEDRADCMAWLGVEPWIDPFRSDPRYRSLLREVGLDRSAR